LSGGIESIDPNGIGSGATVSSGGWELVYGSALATTVRSGALEIIQSGGTLVGATLSGGFLEIKSGGTAGTSQIGFATSAGDTLQLDDSVHFSGTISGFGVPGGIDLRDIAFATATLGYSGDTTSGILTVQDVSSSTAHIHLLGNYTLGSFKTQDDGQGGTLVTDPPVVDPSSLFNPHP